MRKLLVLDAKNYDEALPEINRISVRSIIFMDGKLLLIQSKEGEVKLPGGGQEEGENDWDTLIRETAEETGYHVIPASIQEFGEVEEKRLSTKEPMIWHQINRYYLCEVENEQGDCQYSENEQKHGFRQVWLTLDEAIKLNEEMLQKEGIQAWNQREYTVFKMLKEEKGN